MEAVSPFHPEDLIRLKDEAKSFSEENGWKCVKKTDHVLLMRKASAESAINLFKATMTFPGISPEQVLELIINMDLRREYEKQMTEVDELESCDSYKVVYCHPLLVTDLMERIAHKLLKMVKTPTGASDRDLVQYMTHGRDENGAIYVMLKNAKHPSRPEVPGVVRAETIFSGYMIYPDEGDAQSSRVISVFQHDIKGSVPKFIVNLFLTSTPLNWRDNLIKFYHTEYKLRQ